MKLFAFLSIINLPLRYKHRNKLLSLGGSKIGNKCRIRRKFFIDHPSRLTVGNESFINYFCHIHCGDYGHVTLGENVFIGPDVKICCVSHEIGEAKRRAGVATKDGDIVIEDGAWIGIGATILPGVRIGKGSIVAAGAVVNKDVNPNSLVAGVPARLIRELN